MTRLALLFVLVLGGTSCARHYVIERDVGRVDGERSVATSSDKDWTIRKEPARTDEAR